MTKWYLVLCGLLSIGLMGCSKEPSCFEIPSCSEIERKIKRSFLQQVPEAYSSLISANLSVKAERIGQSHWSVKVVIRDNGEYRSLGGIAIMDAKGAIHYYTD